MKNKEKRYAALEAGPERSLEKKKKKQRDSNKVWSIFMVVSDCRKILVDYRAMRIKLMWI